MYNTSKPVTLQVDASMLGLGGCLLQEDNHGKLRPVAYAFKSLSPAETRYANIERKMLAVVWGDVLNFIIICMAGSLYVTRPKTFGRFTSIIPK